MDLEQHNREIHENRLFWEKKPLLRRVYAGFYREIAHRVDPAIPGLLVELGSGMGNVKEHLPACITTDVFPNPWLDRVENAYHLSFPAGSVGHLILFDVWHHLKHPGTALDEFHRVLTMGGRLLIFEPAMGLFGRVAFGHFHHEPVALDQKIEWDAPADFDRDAPGYYAAQGNATRVFQWGENAGRLLGWRVEEVRHFSGLAYLGSGGFRGPQLYPGFLFPAINRLDAWLSGFPLLASRMLVVLVKV
jgi:hypothetical protein